MEWQNLAASFFWPHHVAVGNRPAAFRSSFGCGPELCVQVWRSLTLTHRLRTDIQDVHMLWTMNYLKHYPTYAEGAKAVGVCVQMYKSKVDYLIEQISLLVDCHVSICLVWYLLFCTYILGDMEPLFFLT